MEGLDLLSEWHRRQNDRAHKYCHSKAPLTEIVADEIILKAKEDGRILYRYRCKECRCFHLTRTKQKKKKPK